MNEELIRESFVSALEELEISQFSKLIKLEIDDTFVVTIKIAVDEELETHAQKTIPVKGISPIIIGRFDFGEKTSYIHWLKVGYFYDEIPETDKILSPILADRMNQMIKEINQEMRNNYLGAFLVILFINMSYKLGMEDVNLQDGTKKSKTTEGEKKNFYEKIGFITDYDNDMTLTFEDIENIHEYFEALKKNIKSHKKLEQYFLELITKEKKEEPIKNTRKYRDKKPHDRPSPPKRGGKKTKKKNKKIKKIKNK